MGRSMSALVSIHNLLFCESRPYRAAHVSSRGRSKLLPLCAHATSALPYHESTYLSALSSVSPNLEHISGVRLLIFSTPGSQTEYEAGSTSVPKSLIGAFNSVSHKIIPTSVTPIVG